MASMQAGWSTERIAPTQNYDLSGYVARINPSIGVHDSVHVGCLYANAGDSALVVSVGVLGFAPEDALAVRKTLAAACDVPIGRIMLAATHTHAAPATMRLNGCGEVRAAWLDELIPAIVRVAIKAKAAARPARIGVGTVRVPGVVRNRRDPAGPTDEALTCIKIECPADGGIFVIGNYACHPVVLSAANRLVSGDYPGAFVDYMAQHGVEAMFITGACGDINPLTHGDFALTTAIGERLGQAALQLLTSIAMEQGSVRGAATTHNVTWEQPPPLQLVKQPDAWAGLLHDPLPDGSDVRRIVAAWTAWIDRHQTKAEPWPTELEVPVQVIQIGPAQLVALPGEAFCQTGLDIKQRLGPATVIAGYTNGNIGYLPTADAYVRGGYEVSDAHVYYGYPGSVAKGTAEDMVRIALNLATGLG